MYFHKYICQCKIKVFQGYDKCETNLPETCVSDPDKTASQNAKWLLKNFPIIWDS